MMNFLRKPKLRCDECQGTFRPRMEDVPEGDGVLRGFQCPHCETRYPVARITARGLEIIEELKTAARPEPMQYLLDEMKGEVSRVR